MGWRLSFSISDYIPLSVYCCVQLTAIHKASLKRRALPLPEGSPLQTPHKPSEGCQCPACLMLDVLRWGVSGGHPTAEPQSSMCQSLPRHHPRWGQEGKCKGLVPHKSRICFFSNAMQWKAGWKRLGEQWERLVRVWFKVVLHIYVQKSWTVLCWQHTSMIWNFEWKRYVFF